ncbi:MAG: enoyl-CoA hydratase-related protein [Candidatus Methylomirabilia bacterium]
MPHTVRYEVSERIATITLDRPAQRHAIDAAMTAALRSAMDRFEADREALVAVLTASGDRAFCAGMDLKAFAAGEGPAILEGPGGFAGFTHRPRTKPCIAAVNGAALAGGCEIVLACDLVVASENALFGFPEVRRGLFASSGGVLRLPLLIPRARALELLLTGEAIDAGTAHDLGLINTVVPHGRLPEAAADLARRICANAPLAVRETLALARALFTLPEEQLQARNDAAWARVAASEDAREGPRAFAEKRPALWREP